MRLLALAPLAPAALALAIALSAAGGGALNPTAATSSCLPAVAAGGNDGQALKDLTPGALTNAKAIYDVTIQMNLPARGAVIAIATALQESGLKNLANSNVPKSLTYPHDGVGSDHDSVGIFQQRPLPPDGEGGWGTVQELMTPTIAASKFLSKMRTIDGWQTLPLTVVAQKVQVSAYPDAYAKWETLATELTQTFVTTAGACVTDGGDGLPVDNAALPPGFTLPAGTPPQIVIAITWVLAQLGTPYHFGGTCHNPHDGNPADECDCSSLMQQAYAHAGITLPRVVADQYRVGTPIYDLNQLQPGDLLFIKGSDGSGGVPGHVGMYIGSGLLVQAPHTGTVVKITSFSDWKSGIMDVRRIIK